MCAPQRKLGQGVNHFDSNRGNDPPRSDLPVRPIAPGCLPPPDAQAAQYQHRAHQAGFCEEVERKIVRRSPDFADLRERGIESQLKRGARELAYTDPGQGSADKHAQCNQPRLPARLGMFARGSEYAIEHAFSWRTEMEQVIEPRHCEMRRQRRNRDAASRELQAPCSLAILNAYGQQPERAIP